MTRFGRRPRTRSEWLHAGLALIAWIGIVLMVFGAAGGTLGGLIGVGTHDWDQMVAHRYLVIDTIKEYGQFPFWNPYGCGGHTNWGGFESAVTIVSPWFPAYLLFSMPIALRIELIGTTLISAWGTWLFAGRFTRSPAARALACALFVVNGRWAFQAAVGHTWHLYYAWTPWALYFFDRACAADASAGRRHYRDAVLAGVAVAMMVYSGAVYPLPQTTFIMGVYALLLTIRLRSTRPVQALAIAGLSALGFASPKLLPVLDVMRRYPRLVDSVEAINLNTFVTAFTKTGQTYGSMPAAIPKWGWHEYGIYVGWVPFLILFAGLIFARGAREVPLKWIGAMCLILGFGAFHEYSPWSLLHQAPIFKSQHVPTRWQYPATLLLGVAAGAALEAALRYRYRLRPWVEILLFIPVVAIGYDIAVNAGLPLRGAMARPMPHVARRAEFRTFEKVPNELYYAERDWTPPALLVMMAHVGSIECGTFPGFHPYYRDQNDRSPGLGAMGDGNEKYRGEAYVLSGQGKARIARFTPNEMVVKLSGARVGDLAILNQNWEAGWSVNGEQPINHKDTLAVRIQDPNQELVFSYRPRLLNVALIIFMLTLFAAGSLIWKPQVIQLVQRIRRRSPTHT